MSNQKEQIIDYLVNNEKNLCDDCLSKILQIQPRQTINALCNKAKKEGILSRYNGICSFCHKNKIINSSIQLNQKLEGLNSTNNNNWVRNDNKNDIITDRLSPEEFENRVCSVLCKQFKQPFREMALVVGENKSHKFDLVSQDKSIIVECKSYIWTTGDNFPSAKISTAIEAAFYLSRIVADKKVIVFQDSLNSKSESLVDVFVRRYGGLLDDIEVWAYYRGESVENDIIKVRREKKSIWYKSLYK
jgi:hypothetical protein